MVVMDDDVKGVCCVVLRCVGQVLIRWIRTVTRTQEDTMMIINRKHKSNTHINKHEIQLVQ